MLIVFANLPVYATISGRLFSFKQRTPFSSKICWLPANVLYHEYIELSIEKENPRKNPGFSLVRLTGLEPAILTELEPKSNVFASFTTGAILRTLLYYTRNLSICQAKNAQKSQQMSHELFINLTDQTRPCIILLQGQISAQRHRAAAAIFCIVFYYFPQSILYHYAFSLFAVFGTVWV